MLGLPSFFWIIVSILDFICIYIYSNICREYFYSFRRGIVKENEKLFLSSQHLKIDYLELV